MGKIINLLRINRLSLSIFCVIILIFSIIDSAFFIPISNRMVMMYQWQKRTGVSDLIITKNIEQADLYLAASDFVIYVDNKKLKSDLVFLSKEDDRAIHSELGKGHNASVSFFGNKYDGFVFDNEINYYFPINNSLFSLLKNTIIIDGLKEYSFVQKGIRFFTPDDFDQFQKGDISIELDSFFLKSLAKLVGLFFLRCMMLIIVLHLCLKTDIVKSSVIFFNRLKFNGVRAQDILIYNLVVLFIVMLPCLVIILFTNGFIFNLFPIIFSNIIIFVSSSFFSRRSLC